MRHSFRVTDGRRRILTAHLALAPLMPALSQSELGSSPMIQGLKSLDGKGGPRLFDQSKDSLKMKSISKRRENLPKGFHEAHGQESGLMPGSFGNRGSNGPVLDTRGNPLYSTRTQRAVARNGHPADKSFHGSSLHPRDVSRLLSRQHRASVSNGLVSKYATRERQRPTAQHHAVGLLFWGKPTRNEVCSRHIAKRQLS